MLSHTEWFPWKSQGKCLAPGRVLYTFQYLGERDEDRVPSPEAWGVLCWGASHGIEQWHWFCPKVHHSFLSTYVACGAMGRVVPSVWLCEWMSKSGTLNRQNKQWPERYTERRKERREKRRKEEEDEMETVVKPWPQRTQRERLWAQTLCHCPTEAGPRQLVSFWD